MHPDSEDTIGKQMAWYSARKNKAGNKMKPIRLIISKSEKQKAILKACYGDDTKIMHYGFVNKDDLYDEIIVFKPDHVWDLRHKAWVDYCVRPLVKPGGTFTLVE